MSTTQRVLGFVAALAAVFAAGLGLGQLVDLAEPAPTHQSPVPQPTDGDTDHDQMEMPDVDE